MKERRELRLPGMLTATVLQLAAALAGAGCGDDSAARDASPPPADVAAMDTGSPDGAETDASGRDASGADGSVSDAAMDALALDTGPADANPMLPDFGPELVYCAYDLTMDAGPDFDAATCGGTVARPEDCPPGCTPLIA